MGGPSALVKLGELLVQQASDAYSFCWCEFLSCSRLVFFFLQLSYRNNPWIPEFPIFETYVPEDMSIFTPGWSDGYMKCAEEIWTFHTSTEAMRFLSWSRADLLASAYDGIPYQHCHQNLKAWSSENRPFLSESELEYKFHLFFPFSSFQSSGMHRCRSLCFRKILFFMLASYLTAQIDFALSSWSAKS